MFNLGKRGGVFSEHMVEILGVVIILTAIGLALTVFSKIGGEGPTLKANIEETTFSTVCDADLVNFLRADSGVVPEESKHVLPSLHGAASAGATARGKGFTFAELLALSEKNPVQLKQFTNATEKFMGQNYKRGNNQPGLWRLTIKHPLVETPFVSFGTLETISELDVCSKLVPTLNPSSPLKAELALEY